MSADVELDPGNYRATCAACEWEGPTWPSLLVAAQDAAHHNAERHADSPGPA